MSTSTSTPAGASALLEGPASGHSTPASYASPHPAGAAGGTSTPTSSASLDMSNLTSHPTYTAMFPDPDLPIANISRIMKRSLPDNAKIAKDAKECVQDCVSELISFITSEASDKCAAEKRKTINGDDILYAMRVLGFDNYEEVLRVYLSRYRMDQENNPKARKRTGDRTAKGAANGDDDEEDDEDEDDDDDRGPAHRGTGPGLANSAPTH